MTTQPEPDDTPGTAHSDDAERVILGALMLQPKLLDEVAEVVTSADFYRPHHAAIYAAITTNAALGEPTEPVALAIALEKFGELAKCGGAGYLHTLMASVPVVVSATWYARKVAECAYARRAEAAAVRLQQAARSGSREAVTVALDRMQRDMASSPGEAAAPWRSSLTNGASFVFDVPDKVPSVWGAGEGVLWASGEALMICGPQGVGKTTLAGQLVAARLGLLPSVLGWPVESGNRRVLYLAMDRPQQAARSMRRLMRAEWRDVLQECLVVWQGPPPADFAASPAVLAEMCRAADADTVVIDSVKDAAVGLAKDEIGAGYNRARQTAIRAGVEVLELHHQRKETNAGGKPKALADVYGSTWIPSGAGSVLLLWGNAGDPVVEMLHIKQPMQDNGPWNVIHDHDMGMSSVYHEGAAADLLYLASHQPHGLTAQAAACAIFGVSTPDRNQVEKARRRLEGYVRTGSLVKRDGGRGGRDSSPSAYFLCERRES